MKTATALAIENPALVSTKVLSDNTTLFELAGYIQSIYLVKQADKLLLLEWLLSCRYKHYSRLY